MGPSEEVAFYQDKEGTGSVWWLTGGLGNGELQTVTLGEELEKELRAPFVGRRWRPCCMWPEGCKAH